MNVKTALDRIGEIKILQRNLEKYIINTDDVDFWSVLNDVDINLSDYVYYLQRAIDKAELDI